MRVFAYALHPYDELLAGAALDTIEHEEGLCYLDRSRDALPTATARFFSA